MVGVVCLLERRLDDTNVHLVPAPDESYRHLRQGLGDGLADGVAPTAASSNSEYGAETNLSP